MKLLVVGNGGREHAIIWKLKQSPQVETIYCASGNAGIGQDATLVPISPMDFKQLISFAKDNHIDFTVVGMDDPLAAGIVDAFEKEGLAIFGPRQNAAILESSKAFSKQFMKKYGIPTANYEVFTEYAQALQYLSTAAMPIVLKADGLALGKGVLICQTKESAQQALQKMMVDKAFGAAGETVVMEEFLTGPEVSVLAFCDGKTLTPMVSAQDHKRALDGDKGLNTGGMGAFSPSRYYTKEIAERCKTTIMDKTLEAMAKEGRPFVGVLYFGLMLTPQGPKVIEYNCRFGDPETQVVLPRLDSDLLEIFLACVEGRLSELEIKWKEDAAACVVLASGGYPEKYDKGFAITGLKEAEQIPGVSVFHSGTARNEEHYLTNGGRVLGVTALGNTLEEAVATAYQGAEKIQFSNKHFRHDIGIR